MPGELFRPDLLEIGKRDLLALDEIHEAGEIGGKVGGLPRRQRVDASVIAPFDEGCRAQALPEGEHEPHQREPPTQRADGGRRDGAVVIVISGPENDGGILVGIAEPPDARQEHGPAFGFGEKRLAQRAARAPGRKIDRGQGKDQRIGLGAAGHRQLARENGSGKRGEERRRRRDSIEPQILWRGLRHLRARMRLPPRPRRPASRHASSARRAGCRRACPWQATGPREGSARSARPGRP